LYIAKQKAIIRLGDGFLHLLPVVLLIGFMQMAPEHNRLAVRLDLFLPGSLPVGDDEIAFGDS